MRNSVVRTPAHLNIQVEQYTRLFPCQNVPELYLSAGRHMTSTSENCQFSDTGFSPTFTILYFCTGHGEPSR